jgi:hypothetical protein
MSSPRGGSVRGGNVLVGKCPGGTVLGEMSHARITTASKFRIETWQIHSELQALAQYSHKSLSRVNFNLGRFHSSWLVFPESIPKISLDFFKFSSPFKSYEYCFSNFHSSWLVLFYPKSIREMSFEIF